MAWISSQADWIKAFHIIFVVCWFACIFYLPRLFVNYAIADNDATRSQLAIMQSKLFRFSIPFAILTLVTGIALALASPSYFLNAKWFYLKIVLVLILFVYHGICGYLVGQFSQGKNRHGHVFFRWFNEFPVLILFAVVILVEVRPF